MKSKIPSKYNMVKKYPYLHEYMMHIEQEYKEKQLSGKFISICDMLRINEDEMTPKKIHEAFRKMALKVHPDLSARLEESEETLENVQKELVDIHERFWKKRKENKFLEDYQEFVQQIRQEEKEREELQKRKLEEEKRKRKEQEEQRKRLEEEEKRREEAERKLKEEKEREQSIYFQRASGDKVRIEKMQGQRMYSTFSNKICPYSLSRYRISEQWNGATFTYMAYTHENINFESLRENIGKLRLYSSTLFSRRHLIESLAKRSGYIGELNKETFEISYQPFVEDSFKREERELRGTKKDFEKGRIGTNVDLSRRIIKVGTVAKGEENFGIYKLIPIGKRQKGRREKLFVMDDVTEEQLDDIRYCEFIRRIDQDENFLKERRIAEDLYCIGSIYQENNQYACVVPEELDEFFTKKDQKQERDER